jgi:hypothetical protein
MALTVKKIERLGEGRHHDGRGLYLTVAPSGAASWAYRFKINGKERWMGLGGLHDINLDEARERAWNARQLLKKDKIDPLDVKKAERFATAKQITFEEAARDYFKGHEQKWSNKIHSEQFLSSLQTYAFDQIGKLPVAKIDTTVVLEVLKPIWYAKTVTAGRVRNRIESVLDRCTASGYRTGPNPAAWSGHLEAILPAKSEIAKVEHHRALPFEDIPNFMEALASRKGFDARAMEFLVLCAGRTSEITPTSTRQLASLRFKIIGRQIALW